MMSYLLILRKPIRRQVPAHVFGEVNICGIQMGPPVPNSDKVDGNKYTVEMPIKNKRDVVKNVKVRIVWFTCLSNTWETCGPGRADNNNKKAEERDITLQPNETRVLKVTAEQIEGACGMFQVDYVILSVEPNNNEGDCSTQGNAIGGLYWYPNACGVAPTNTPVPTQPQATNTPVPGVTNIPTPTSTPRPGITNTPTPTSTPRPGATNTPTPSSTPPPGATNTPVPTSTPPPAASLTPIPQSCGIKSCDNTTNPCKSGLICQQANDGSNYCTFPEFKEACKANPSQSTCCTPPGNSPTPTETILVQATSTPGPTTVAAVTEIPPAGVTTFGKIFGVISIAVILLGLIL